MDSRKRYATPASISIRPKRSNSGRTRRNTISAIGCANKPSATSMDCHNHHSDQTTRAASSATTIDSVTSSGVAQGKTRTRIRTIAEIQGQHVHTSLLATTMRWTCRPLSIKQRPKKIKKSIERQVDALSVANKATWCKPAQAKNLDKVRMLARSPLKTTSPTICPSIAAAIRASRPLHLPRSRCISLTKKKERLPESSRRWEPM